MVRDRRSAHASSAASAWNAIRLGRSAIASTCLEPDDRLWCRLAPAEYWRFYWPLEYVDFLRFKERFLLAANWTLPLAGELNPSVRCMRLAPPADLCQPVHRMALARVTLSRAEWSIFRLLKSADEQLNDWLFGRIAAKDAIRSLWMERHGQRLFPADIELDTQDGGSATASYRGESLVEGLPPVAFASLMGLSFAVAAFGRDVRLTLRRCGDEVLPHVILGEAKQP